MPSQSRVDIPLLSRGTLILAPVLSLFLVLPSSLGKEDEDNTSPPPGSSVILISCRMLHRHNREILSDHTPQPSSTHLEISTCLPTASSPCVPDTIIQSIPVFIEEGVKKGAPRHTQSRAVSPGSPMHSRWYAAYNGVKERGKRITGVEVGEDKPSPSTRDLPSESCPPRHERALHVDGEHQPLGEAGEEGKEGSEDGRSLCARVPSPAYLPKFRYEVHAESLGTLVGASKGGAGIVRPISHPKGHTATYLAFPKL
ncbi:hypothetical protein BJ684DRAFT_17792 [Piptocephalis cylindrospora]|uniref:Uncharacterized protein n=1 Tax=Piptocephalis cylindrospora TaxID=1907219 RepID=A0A4P9XYZ8_9FUNG|nr:hypothetical protein BJ684DRAFT_17792 [Piptocephalis cylindrospora]|eukprot:RKP11637.1 hypothetical protein BJ684DRAFT_17792 [Piptocephalis cylindrospora]